MAQLESELDTVVTESTLLTTLPYHFSKIMTMKSADIYMHLLYVLVPIS